MADQLGDLTRTHTCGALRADDVGADVVLLGWVHRVRDLGGVTFIDIRDRAGVSQVVVRENEALAAVAKRLRSEYVIGVSGVVQRRSADTINAKLASGEVEVLARDIRLLNEARTPPFQIAEDSPVSEDVRLRYRYLDLRRTRLQQNIGLRHRLTMAIRRFFDSNGFWEIETPILTKSTPEGARDYLVPSRVHPGEFYALPQSPQLFKQILMIAGADRYFQIVRCFRDEDLRADRQPEFTQVDIEVSFARPETIFELIEPLMQQIFREIGRDVATPFRRMSYAEAMARYGSDKPDLRFALDIVDLSELFRDSEFNVFKRIELGVAEQLREVDNVQREPEVGFVRSVSRHRFRVRHAAEWRGDITADLSEDLMHQRLDELEDRLRPRKRYLNIDLRKLRLAIGSQVFVAEAAHNLEVAIGAGDHQDLLEDLRRLRQRVKLAGVNPARNEIIASPFRRGLGQNRCFNLPEAVRIEIAADCKRRPMAQADVALHVRPAQVEIPVAEANVFGYGALFGDRKRRRLRLVQDEDPAREHLDLAGRQL